MLTSFPFAVIVGVILGYLAGLGVGGGSLLIIWLTLVLKMDHSTARAINLMFFIASASAVSLFRWKKGQLKIKKILPAMITGCIAAGIFSWVGKVVDVDSIRKFFGFLLLITGIRELAYRPRKAK